ncbi:GNAT family N-acetyltransferase [Bacillus lacus]|uniref:GNAT family N-acetyltransferase n=2 Tax=Metabacillus lacus TaxID=1983721 RepID=A0A7X2LZY3_9BACI|nr:GNAT family N-acetyltransferase [Metabacillus lacus]MRX73941.1 GNAT family N-acetyltransferase [Metabacillus lacus]
MESIRLEKANEGDAEAIFQIQLQAFKPLLDKYQDHDTNPGNESIDRVFKRIHNPNGAFYKIIADETLAGAICVYWKEGCQFWISPMFISPEFQGKGIGQRAITLVENEYQQAVTWELATIQEEERNCYLYEKMGYVTTEVRKKLNERTTLVFYKKTVVKK